MVDLETRVAELELAVLALTTEREMEFGDVQGHLFHGNQWSDGTSGEGNDGKPAGDPGATRAADAPFPKAENKSGYGLSPSYRTQQYTSGGRLMGGDMVGKAAAILPTGSSVNLHKPEKSDFIDNVVGQTVHIVDVKDREGGPSYRAISTYGGPTWNVGDRVFMNHDQNPGRSLHNNSSGSGAEVVGTMHQDGRMEGTVPNKSIPLWVFK